MRYYFILYVIWNLIVFGIIGFDKYKAVHHKYRISESFLLWCAVLFGALGEFIGMFYFHHKTKKLKFQIIVPFAFFIQLLFIYSYIV